MKQKKLESKTSTSISKPAVEAYERGRDAVFAKLSKHCNRRLRLSNICLDTSKRCPISAINCPLLINDQ